MPASNRGAQKRPPKPGAKTGGPKSTPRNGPNCGPEMIQNLAPEYIKIVAPKRSKKRDKKLSQKRPRPKFAPGPYLGRDSGPAGAKMAGTKPGPLPQKLSKTLPRKHPKRCPENVQTGARQLFRPAAAKFDRNRPRPGKSLSQHGQRHATNTFCTKLPEDTEPGETASS